MISADLPDAKIIMWQRKPVELLGFLYLTTESMSSVRNENENENEYSQKTFHAVFLSFEIFAL